jgi:hypothetical protein
MSSQLCLFYRKNAPSSEEAKAYLLSLERRYPEFIGQLDFVDMDETPEKARGLGIIATPTLLISNPHPPRRVIGSLEGVEALLGIKEGFLSKD